MSTFSEYEGTLKSYDPEMFIGNLVWYSVPTTVRIPYEELCKKILDTFGAFETDMPLPRAPQPHNVFKRACANVGKIKRDGWLGATTMDPNPAACTPITNRYLIHDAGHDTYGIYRELVKEVLDKDGHKLSHQTLGKLTFMRVARGIDSNAYPDISDEDREMFEGVAAQVGDYFAKNASAVTSDGIRYVILDMLQIVMRSYTARSSGGVYFVQNSHSQYLGPLSEMLGSITDDTGTDRVQFHSLPLMDDEVQRNMLKHAFTADVSQRFNEVANEIVPILNGKNDDGSPKKITAKRFATLNAQFKDAKALIGEQQELLKDGLDKACMTMTVLDKQMGTMLGRVKS